MSEPKPGFSKQAQIVFQATQALWHESNVERHAEGHPGLSGEPGLQGPGRYRKTPINPDLNHIKSAIYALNVILERLTVSDDLSDREWLTLRELELHTFRGIPYFFNPKTCVLLVNKGLAIALDGPYTKVRYQITDAGRIRLKRK